MRCWDADSDVHDGRALELGSERGDDGFPSCVLGREELESREYQQEIKVGHGT